MPRWYSNPQLQQTSGRKPTPYTGAATGDKVSVIKIVYYRMLGLLVINESERMFNGASVA